MRAIVFAVAALLLWGCHASRSVGSEETAQAQVRAMRTLRLDSSALFAIVEIDSPRLVLSPDTARPSVMLSGRSLRAAVARDEATVEATAAVDSAASSASRDESRSQGDAAAPSQVAWWAVLAAAVALILLSWRGIRLRR